MKTKQQLGTGHADYPPMDVSQRPVEDGEDSHRDNSGALGVSSVFWAWRFEFIVLLLSFGLLGTMFGVLSSNHDKLVMDWYLSGISLNTLVAVLSAFLRAMILTITEEVISQHKWIWQLTPQPAIHLSHIDRASRGLWGALTLPTRLRVWASYIYIGCLITVLSLSVGPFAQQAAGTKECVKTISNTKAQLPYTYEGVPFLLQQTYDWNIEPGYHNAIIGAVSNSKAVNSSSLIDACPSGNCTFPTNSNGYSLSTLGVCSRCMDTTRYIRKLSNESGLVGIPDVIIFNMSSDYHLMYNSTLKSVISGADEFVDIDFAQDDFDDDFNIILPATISNMTLLGMTSSGCSFANDTQNITQCTPSSGLDFTIDYKRTHYPGMSRFNLYSTTCTFYWCMRYHESYIERNTLHETLVAENPGFMKPGEGYANSNSRIIHNWKPSCNVDGEELDLTKAKYISNDTQSTKAELRGAGSETRDIPDSANCTVRVDEQASQGLRKGFGNLMGQCIYKWGAGIVPTLRQRIEHVDCDPVHLFGLMNDGIATFSSTADVMSVVATAITNRMRENARTRSFKVRSQDIGNQDRGGFVDGEAHQTSVCTDFQWKWLLGPTALLLITVGSLIQAVSRSVFQRNREPLWKASILPAIYASPGSQLQTKGYTLAGLEETAKKDYLSLSKTGKDKWEFVKETGKDVGYNRAEGDNVALMDLSRGSSVRRLSI